MYVRHCAWLAATPEGADKSRSEALNGEHEMPPIECFDWLINILFEIGAGLSYRDIKDFMEVTGVILSQEECSMLKGLSDQYMSQYSKSRDKKCPAPYRPKTVAPQQVQRSILRPAKR